MADDYDPKRESLPPEEARACCWHLVMRREVGSPKTIKYSLSNAPADTPLLRLAQMQGHRYWVERVFEDAKGQCGLADYQALGWQAWHHHVTMVMLAMLSLPSNAWPKTQALTYFHPATSSKCSKRHCHASRKVRKRWCAASMSDTSAGVAPSNPAFAPHNNCSRRRQKRCSRM